MRTQAHRIGLIVPSSNTTMETEVPELLRRQQERGRQRFTFHSTRLRLQQVTPEALQLMNRSADSAVDLLCDAQVDAIMYACLVAVMFGGRACIADTQVQLTGRAAAASQAAAPAVVTSAAALVGALKHLKARRVTLLTPYRKELTTRVAATLAEYDIDVEQSRSLEVIDNVQVGRLDPHKLLTLASQLDLRRSQALVLSACVQMPSLAVIEEAEQRFGLPVLSAATASVFELLNRLDIEPDIRDAGSLLRRGSAAA
jgi:maleate isomerase